MDLPREVLNKLNKDKDLTEEIAEVLDYEDDDDGLEYEDMYYDSMGVDYTTQ
tara:strand:+ start:314 stop:469 length:156 start_codon:yes stop_codon:yes gene_type:complete